MFNAAIQTSTGPMLSDRHTAIWSNPMFLAAATVAVLFLSEFRWGMSWLGILVPVLLLRFLRVSQSPKALLQVLGILIVGYTLAIAKIATHPIPIASSPMFGVPIGLMHFCTYTFYHLIRNHVKGPAAILLFPVAGTVFQWSIAALTPFSSWGVSAYLFIDNLPLAQSLSIFGMAGLNFMFLWFAVCIESFLSRDWHRSTGVQLSLLLSIYLGLFAWGNWRLDQPLAGKWESAAAIKTDWHVSQGFLSQAEQDDLFSELADRSRRAALAGARVVVWTEASTMVRPENEAELVEKLQALARENNIHLVAAYAAPVTEEPLTYENKYLWISADGIVQQDYLKRHPVPGEPAVKGEWMPDPTVSPMGLSSGAICFDFDFPEEALARAAMGADFVALPSSDWKGIDPIHSQMAAFRSIEGGFSTLRTTNLGLSVGINPYGQILSRMDHFDHSSGIMLVQLPVNGVTTLYSQIGDLPVYICIAIILLTGISTLWSSGVRRREQAID